MPKLKQLKKAKSLKKLRKEFDKLKYIDEGRLDSVVHEKLWQFAVKMFKEGKKEGVTEAKRPRENARGYLVEGEPCPFCKGTGDNPSNKVQC